MENIVELQNRFASLKASEPNLRSRQLAEKLKISEAELLTLENNGNVSLLSGDWKELLKELHLLGNVMALTRNEACVHERKGQYDNITFYDGPHNMGVAVNPDIDLRLFMNEWKYGFFVKMLKGNRELYSIQFFNDKGIAVHKIFSTPQTNVDAFINLVSRYKSTDKYITIANRETPPKQAEKADTEVDIDAFQQEWTNLKDTHHFFGMLKKYGLSRTQALRLAPEGMVTAVDKESISDLLRAAVNENISIMCFVHSPGCIQIHTGPINRLMWHGHWFNIMDPKFNLHLNTQAIDACYIVRKPTADGNVTSFEIFDKNGELIVYFFGERKPGKPELEGWRRIIENIATTCTESTV